ncbi:hypothetical protein TNCV_1112201 [Trichonephila clavipes]|uniref:Uncharacterized protein n=1 Tax=Trichonephila clavipes TaxID=2585209 RepID=A0A8X6UY99_TRICX|nr:hypothetical protein TNCV_1112201 [Trichonephila clavipes]
MGLEVRLSLAMSTIQVTVRFSSVKIPKGKIDGNTTSLSPPPQFLHDSVIELPASIPSVIVVKTYGVQWRNLPPSTTPALMGESGFKDARSLIDAKYGPFRKIQVWAHNLTLQGALILSTTLLMVSVLVKLGSTVRVDRF